MADIIYRKDYNKYFTLINSLIPLFLIFFYYFVINDVFIPGYLLYGWNEMLLLSTFVSIVPDVAYWFLFGIKVVGASDTAQFTLNILILSGSFLLLLSLLDNTSKPTNKGRAALLIGGILTFPLGIVALISFYRTRSKEQTLGIKDRFLGEIRKNKLPYVLIIPFIVFLAFTYIIPIIRGFYITLFTFPDLPRAFNPVDYSTDPLLWTIHAILGGLQRQDPAYIGIDNYLELFSGTNNAAAFQKALGNNIFFVLLFVPGVVIVALLLSVLLNSKLLKGENAYTTIFYMPVVTSILVVAVIWGRVIFEPNSGILSMIFTLIAPLLDLIYGFLSAITFGFIPALKADVGVNWLSKYLMESISVMSIWRRVGFDILILLAGLKSIPKSLYEAADIDGHGSLSQFRNITLPMLKGPLGVVMVLELINGWQIFQELYGLNQAGTDNTLAVYLISHYADPRVMTFASTVGYFIFAMTAFLGLLDRVEARGTLKMIPLFALFAVLFNIPSNRTGELPPSLGFSAAWTYDQLFLLLALLVILYYLIFVVFGIRLRPLRLKPVFQYDEVKSDFSGLKTTGYFVLFASIFYYLNGYDTLTKSGLGSTLFIGSINSMTLGTLFFICGILMILSSRYVPFFYQRFHKTQEWRN
ncbi:MAG: carbohydrate ABC transporter permease [Candidatus Hodarchaeales archaeon]|jgi:multiple sugar transport system permease protein